jgi:GTP-binding protein
LVRDADRGHLLKDLTDDGQTIVIAQGGKGGKGNKRFATSTHRAPRETEPGEEGEKRNVVLELKLIADVGLIGLPNAGKSTLLSRLSKATPEIANYPFTTKYPNLGLVQVGYDHQFVVADIPGLIEGAATGAGLGHDFLRHIERTAVLVHVLDIAPLDDSDPAKNYEVIRQELLDYSMELAEKPEVLVFNKVDLIAEDERAERVKKLIAKLRLPRDVNPILVSGATGEGVKEMLEACWAARGKKREAVAWEVDSR